ncbi:Rtr1/RPAP2 family-domain-containing protein [Pseudomassariella vexata]|uniref:RNA polymerase II subunit B1 CTD phosphatase RPAP2 homolog n=1 Tax=Pseudomassariella vexata TaxID=1141098 RepID=A0A1Y2DVF7_9PEZI|nr:Rtr1/RPAP2 family-domain-containing protein [Pseudomassariella vexata]ORY63124.1 Rtr1/RPAP2 family-domain-containing protein [Pseudomassariella vexata]
MATQSNNPLKGILKKPIPPAADPKVREVAVQHANIIQQRKELEDTITDYIIELSKLPLDRSSPYTSSSPSPTDAATFKSHVRLFQPSDYEDLISERNANGLCGYTLCPKPRMRVAQRGEYKLINYGRKDFSIVPKKEIERWCGAACARRAMWIKVQLNDTSAWERAGIDSIEIGLYEEPKKTEEDEAARRLTRDMAGLQVEAERKAAKDAQELALERGDTDEGAKRKVDVRIQENSVKGVAEEPSLGKDDDGHLVTEGYKTKFDSQKNTASKNTTGI